MAKGQKHIIIDNYTYELIEQAIKNGMATNIDAVVGKGVAKLLDVRYKSREERKLEQETARIQGLGKMAMKEE